MDEPTPTELPGPDELPRLAAALLGLGPEMRAVPASGDAAVLSVARATLGRGRSRGRRWLLAPLAAAAAVVVAVVLRGEGSAPRAVPGVRGDVDGDGRVDILDAFALARRISGGGSGTDVTGDGTVDAADVRAIALIAVTLPPGRPQ